MKIKYQKDYNNLIKFIVIAVIATMGIIACSSCSKKKNETPTPAATSQVTVLGRYYDPTHANNNVDTITIYSDYSVTNVMQTCTPDTDTIHTFDENSAGIVRGFNHYNPNHCNLHVLGCYGYTPSMVTLTFEVRNIVTNIQEFGISNIHYYKIQ